MTAASMDGSALARKVLDAAGRRAATLVAERGVTPCLATVLVGEDPASATYVKMKQNRCRDAGIESLHVPMPAGTSTGELVRTISGLSADPSVHGILLQHPVPPPVDEREAFEAIAPAKDVDGVTLHSFACMAFGYPGFAACTPGGIMRLLDEYGVEPRGLHAVVIGRSPILGKPMGMLLLQRDATVTYCHSRTVDLPSIVLSADIVVAAVGRPEFVRGEWIREGATVVDAGYNPGNVGDVAAAEAAGRAGLLTPVPGGVGPMTIAVLIDQTVEAAFRQIDAVAGRTGSRPAHADSVDGAAGSSLSPTDSAHSAAGSP